MVKHIIIKAKTEFISSQTILNIIDRNLPSFNITASYINDSCLIHTFIPVPDSSEFPPRSFNPDHSYRSLTFTSFRPNCDPRSIWTYFPISISPATSYLTTWYIKLHARFIHISSIVPSQIYLADPTSIPNFHQRFISDRSKFHIFPRSVDPPLKYIC